MNCKKFDFNLYFKMEELARQLSDEQVTSPSEIFKKFKQELKDNFGLDEITDSQLKDYFSNSSFDQDLKKQLVNYNDVKSEEIKKDDIVEEIIDEESYEEKPELISVKDVLIKDIKSVKKLNTVNDLYDAYFSGAYLNYNRFKQEFKKNIFSASLLSFDKNNSFIIKSNEDINENISLYKDKLLNDLMSYLGTSGLTVEQSLELFEDQKIKNIDAFNSEFTEDDSLAKAYNAFITLNHFDDLVKMFSSIIELDPKTDKYKLVLDHKLKNNFSDSPVDIIAEVSKLVKSIIEFTPVLDKNGKPLKGRYLKMSEVTGVISKLKTLNGDYLESTLNIRFNPEENISQLIESLLQHSYVPGLVKSDFDILRSIYNYYYKTGDENSKVSSQMNSDTVSIRKIKNEEYKNKNYSDPNIIADCITTTIDKTIDQKYVTLKETDGELVRKLTSDITINKYLNQMKSDFNAKSNSPLNLKSTELSYGKDNFQLSLNGNNVVFNINGFNLDIPENDTPSLSLWEENLNFKISPEDIFNYLSGNGNLEQNKINYLDILKVISDATGVNFFQSNGEMILNIPIGIKFLEEGLYNAGRILRFRSIYSNYMDQKINNPNLKLSEYLENSNISVDQDNIYGDRFTPFNKIKTTEFFKQTSFGIALLKGDISSSISRNLNGDGLPNSSLLNLIGDYRTIFEQHKNAKKEDSVTDNLFVQNDNYNLIEGVVFRSDIEMQDGSIKNVKNFNAGEIMQQAIFSDFWGNAFYDKGLVMLEPTVFADKSGQPMKIINMSKKFNYQYVNPKTNKIEFQVNNQSLFELSNLESDLGLSSKLDDLHFYTMKAQYSKMYTKLMNDYKFLINNMISSDNLITDPKDDKKKIKVSNFVSSVVKDISNPSLEEMSTIINSGVKLEDYRIANDGTQIDIQLEFHYTKGGVNGLLNKKFKEYQILDYDKTYYKRRMNQENKKFATSYEKLNGDYVVLNDDGSIKPDFENVIKSYLINVKGKSETSDMKKDINNFINSWVKSDGTIKIYSGVDNLKEEDIYKSNVQITLNPLLQVMQSSNRTLMGNYNLAMVGGPHGHKMKANKKQVMKMFDKDLNDITYQKNNQKYIFDDLMKVLKDKDKVLEEIWEEVEESARTIAMHKRMVAYQAKIHTFTQGLITGVIPEMRMLVMKDVTFPVWNTVGDKGDFDVADGSGWVPMVAAILFRNSMGDAGTDSISLKAIRHAIDGDTGIAELDKYALQALSNEVLRQSALSKSPWANLNKIALNSVKFNEVFPGEVGNIFDPKYQINPNKTELTNILTPEIAQDAEKLKEFIRNSNDIPTFLSGKDVMYSIEGTGIITKLKSIIYDPATGDYIVKKQFSGPLNGEMGITSEEGYTMVDESHGYKRIKLNSLYDIWNEILGGMYSISKAEHDGKIRLGEFEFNYSDDSNEALAQFMNNIVIKKDDNLVSELAKKGIKTSKPNDKIKTYSQTNYYQPLKESLIWQINNASGMKNGAKNVNGNNILKNGDAKPGYFKTSSLHYGIQGNFDHKFSETHEARVTEATQVISAAETNGYMTEDVNRLYKALAKIVEYSIKDEKKAYLDKDGKIAEMIAKTLVRSLATGDRIGLGQAYGIMFEENMKKLKEENPNSFKYSELEYKMAFTDPNFQGAMVSMISGVFNNSVIRRDLPGLASVLSQAHDAIMVVDSDNGILMGNTLFKDYRFKQFNKIKKQIKEAKNDIDRNNITREFNNQINTFKNQLNSGQYGDFAKETEIRFEDIDNYDILRLKDSSGNYIDFEIMSPKEYINLKNGKYKSIDGAKSLKGDVKLYRLSGIPRNLKSSRLHFTDGNLNLNEMDLDGSRAIWHLNDFIKGDEIEPHIQKLIQNTFNELGFKESDYFIDEENERSLPKNIKNQIKKRLIIKQQYQFALLQKGIFTYKGNEIQGSVNIVGGELILPNYNQHKFGLSEGVALSDITIDYFRNKFSKFNDVADKSASFYLQDKLGDHVYLLDEAEFKSKLKSSKTAEDVDFKIKEINGEDYYVDNNGNIVFKALPNMQLKRLDGKLYATYNTIRDINTLISSDYYVSVGYNFNEKNLEVIKSYIERHDFKNISCVSKEIKNASSARAYYESTSDYRFENYLKDIMHSWDKQLDMIGARIPAQSLQSFMAMKIVGFTEKNVNRAYVPIKKNWLDGSDFDIDKIYMSGFSVNRNGKLQTWTPYFDLSHVEKSLEMPFPDGEERTPVKEKSKFNTDLINSYVEKYKNNQLTEGLEFNELVNFLNSLQDSKVIPANGLTDDSINYIQSYFDTVISDKTRLLDASKNAAIGALYKISKSPVNMMSGNRGVDMNDPQAGAEKSPKTWAAMQWSMDNYATLPSMKEENGAGKAVIGISAVGIKVFYAMSHVQNQNILKLDEEFSKGYSSLEDLKSKNISEYTRLKQELRKIANPKTIDLKDEDGNSYKVITNLIANINLHDKSIVNEAYSELLDELRAANPGVKVLDIRFMDDYSLTLSALLSAATDNAKELILAKINAGPELAGMYVYMIIQGVSFDDITDFMVSPTVDSIVAKSKSNIFLGKDSSIDKSIKYYLEGVPVDEFLTEIQRRAVGRMMNKNKKKFFELLTPSGKLAYTKDNGSIKSFEFTLSKYIKNLKPDATLKFIELINNNLGKSGNFFDKIDLSTHEDLMNGSSTVKSTNLDKPLKRFLKEMEKRHTQLSKYMNIDKVKEFAKMYDESKELTELGGRLGINGGMGTDLYSHYNYNQKLSNFFTNKIFNLLSLGDNLTKEAFNNPKNDLIKQELEIVEEKVKKLLQLFRKYFNNDNLKFEDLTQKLVEEVTDARKYHQVINPNNVKEYNEHIERQNLVREIYDVVKSKFNIFEIETKAPHYNSMIGAQNFAMSMFSEVSTGYEYTLKLMDKLSDMGYVKRNNKAKHKFKEDEVKKISNFILSDLVNQFMDNTDIPFMLPKGNYFYDKDFKLCKAEDEISMNLNTIEGRISFKLFMDNNKDLFKQISSSTQGNEFLDNLVTDVKKDSLTTKEIEFLKLNIDMNNIKNDIDQIQFQEMTNGFRHLKRLEFSVLPGKSVADAFFIYNLIMNNNSFGKTAFTKIFENDLKLGEVNIISEFFKFVGDVDYSKFTNHGSLYGSNVDFKYLGMTVAESKNKYDNLNKDHGKYIKIWNDETKSYDFKERIKNSEYPFISYIDVVDFDSSLNNIPTKLYLQKSSSVDYDVKVKNSLHANETLNKLISNYEKGDIKILIKC